MILHRNAVTSLFCIFLSLSARTCLNRIIFTIEKVVDVVTPVLIAYRESHKGITEEDIVENYKQEREGQFIHLVHHLREFIYPVRSKYIRVSCYQNVTLYDAFKCLRWI